MKKVSLLLLIAIIFLTGCSEEEYQTQTTPTIKSVQMEYSDFDLAIDKKTNIVYIKNIVTTYKGESGWANDYYIYTPYYSENGKLCKFNGEKIVEVE